MSTIANIKVNASGTDKAAKELDKVGKATDRVGRNQTRLGQASASAGREFAAQSAGLGGLVQAYAGAAANIFAITAAFTALNQAARFEQIIAGTNALASSIGANGRDIINSVQEITKSQLSLLETAQTVNIGLAAGFNTQQIEDLSDVSLRASKALGRSLTDAFTRVSRGAAKLEPELLDELGIFTRIDPAVRAYADSVGRSVSSLTNFERRQAFANAVIAEGQRKFRDVDTSTNTAAESLEKLSSTIVNLGLGFGSVLATGVAPLADFITGNLSNSLALFGLLAKQVGGLAVTVLAAGVQKATASLTALGDSAVVSLNNLSKSYKQATAAAAEFAKSKVTLTRFGTQEERQIKLSAQGLLQEAAAGKLNTAAKIENAKASLRAARAVEIEFARRSQSNANKLAAVNAARALTRQIVLLDAAQRKAAVGTTILSTAVKGLTLAVGFLGGAIGKVIGVLFTVITVASLVQLALDALGKAFGFNVNILEKITGFIQKFFKSLRETLEGVQAFSAGFRTELEAAARSAGAFGEDVGKAITAAQKAIANFELVRLRGSRFSEALSIEVALKQLADKSGPAAVAVFRVIERELRALGGGSIFVGRQLSKLFSAISEQSGVAAKDVSKILRGFSDFNRIAVTAGAEGLSIAGTQIAKLVDGTFQFKDGFLEATSVIVQGIDKINDFNTGLTEGLLDAERAASAVGAIQNTIVQSKSQEKNLTDQLNALNKTLQGDITDLTNTERERLEISKSELEEAIKFLRANTEILRIEENIAAARAARLADLEKEAKIRDKIFGKGGEKLDQATLRGTIGPGGEVAQTGQERRINQLTELSKRLTEINDLFDPTNRVTSTTSPRNLIRARNELAVIDRITGQIKAKNKELRELTDKGKGDTEAARNISIEINRLEDELVRAKEDDLALTSQLLQARKDQTQISQILANLEVEFLSTLEKELQTVEKIANARDIARDKAQLDLEKQRIVTAKKLLDITIQQEKASLEYTKSLMELFGIFTDRSNVAFLQDKFQIELKQAEADKKAAIDAALVNFAAAEAQRETQKAAINLENEKIKIQVNFLRDQALVFFRHEDNLARIFSQHVKGMSEATGRTTTVTSIRGGNPTDVTGSGAALTKQISDTFDEAVKAANDANELIRSKNEEQLAFIMESEEKKLEVIKMSQQRQLELAQIEGSVRFKVFKSFADGTNETLGPALEGVFQSIADGTFTVKNLRGELNNFFRDLIENIRKKLLKETLIDPLSEGITSSFKGAFFGGGPGAGQGNMFGNFFTGLFGGGKKATGGLVHMAGGGQVRDRVPAMLEPGEFVIRRPMAKAIGGEALGAMNATGTMPAGEVTVNITNQGTPQEASASKPRFDGEKFVIDIVTRDLRNNGPIRKSLRGGA